MQQRSRPQSSFSPMPFWPWGLARRSMIEFALPNRHIVRIRALAEKLRRPQGPPGNIDLTEAGLCPGWQVQKRSQTEVVGQKHPRDLKPDQDPLIRRSRIVYEVWTPESRDPRMPWALGPPALKLSREQLIAFLQERWVPDALAALEEDALALTEHDVDE